MIRNLYLRAINSNSQQIAVFTIWLFHISALIGISIGFQDWFVSKTPLNLALMSVLLVMHSPFHKIRFWIGMTLFFMGGMLVEYLGVQYSLFFGSYEYGTNMGPKFGGVPWLIGLNWALLTMVTGVISYTLFKNTFVRIFTGASLMVFLDVFLEHSAPVFNYWQFEGGTVPLDNYIAWFVISLIFHAIFKLLRLYANPQVSVHLYVAQLVYFFWFFSFN